MDILVTCRRCGTEWQPEPRAFVRGLWRLCPACDAETRAGSHAPGETSHSGAQDATGGRRRTGHRREGEESP